MRCPKRPDSRIGIVSHVTPFAVLIRLRLRQSFFVYCTSS
jgi:hypothetical protein